MDLPQVLYLGRGFDPRWNGVPVLVDALRRLLPVFPHAHTVGGTFGPGRPDLDAKHISISALYANDCDQWNICAILNPL